MIDIFKLAKGNTKYLEDRYNELKLKNHGKAKILDNFKDFVRENWTVSINFRCEGLKGFLEDGVYLNAYDLARKKAKSEKKDYEIALREHLGDNYEKRLTFDRTFKDGEKFKYCALYVGGLGATKYGRFCVVFKKDEVRNWNLVFIKEDTLNYVDNDVDIDRLKRDLADKESVHHLVAIKYYDQIEDCPVNERETIWGSIVCHDDEYIDSITTDEIGVKHICKVKICHELLFKGVGAYTEDPSFDDANRGFVNDYFEVIKLLRRKNINYEVI